MKEADIERIVEQLSGKGEAFPLATEDSPEEENRLKQLEAIARMMREEPAPEPPANLGDCIMSRLRTRRPSPWKVLSEALLKPHEVSFHPLNALRSPISGQECSFYFIMVGAFYAILGMILMVGLHKLGESLVTLGWVRWQPQIALATALCMVAMGLYLLNDGRLALRIARIGALIYLGFAFLNGIIVPLEWDIPVSAFVSMLSSLVGVPTGFFLFRAIQNCGKRYA
ncbi:MAG TPA: hypothetical protein VMB77_14925 [Syntrophales bacterium]|nr:hypothetical protein [Syntrophales bacterium]